MFVKVVAAMRLSKKYLLMPTIGNIGRFMFGNNAGLLNNIRGKRLRTSDNSHAISHNSKSLITDGFMRVEQTKEQMQLITDLQKRIVALLSQTKNNPSIVSAGGKGFVDSHVLIKNPSDIFPELKQLITEDIFQLISDYYRNGFALKHLRIWRNYGVDINPQSKNLFSNQWHNDEFVTTRLKLFIYLSNDVDKSKGATEFITREKTTAIMRSFGYLNRDWVSNTVNQKFHDDSFFCRIEGGVGTTFFLNATELLHRAGIPEPGKYRDIIQFEFDAALTKPSKETLFDDLVRDDLNS